MKGRLSSAPEGCASTKSVWVAQTYPLPNEVHLSGGTPCNPCEYIDLTAAELSKRTQQKPAARTCSGPGKDRPHTILQRPFNTRSCRIRDVGSPRAMEATHQEESMNDAWCTKELQ